MLCKTDFDSLDLILVQFAQNSFSKAILKHLVRDFGTEFMPMALNANGLPLPPSGLSILSL